MFPSERKNLHLGVVKITVNKIFPKLNAGEFNGDESHRIRIRKKQHPNKNNSKTMYGTQYIYLLIYPLN